MENEWIANPNPEPGPTMVPRTSERNERAEAQAIERVAHELRQPLIPIQAALRQMERSSDQATLDSARRTIERQVDQLSRMVEGLLDAVRTRSEAVDLRRTRLDLCMFASEAAEAFRPLIAQRRQRLDVFVPPVALWVDADPVRLYQILSNLLLNASTFTPGSGRVWVHVETADDRVAVTVGDTGRGIPADTLPHIFELFVQGPGTRGRLGLGLAVVKQLTVLHGGTVEGFSDGPDCGSRFVVTLPAADDPGVPPSGSATH